MTLLCERTFLNGPRSITVYQSKAQGNLVRLLVGPINIET